MKQEANTGGTEAELYRVSVRELRKDTGKQKGWRAFLEQGISRKSSPWAKL